MWDCPGCGCSAIAGTLTFCPMCFKEREMPKNTVGGGYSDKSLPVPEDEAVPYAEDNAEHDPDRGNGPDQPELPFSEGQGTEETVPAASDNTDAASDYSSYSVRDLVELCKARGIAYSGPAGTLPKDALAARLSEPPKE